MLWASYDKEKYVMIDCDVTSPGGRRRKRYRERKRSSGRQGRTRGYICKMKLGKAYDAGSMWMVRKSEETEKAKQRSREGTSKRMPLIAGRVLPTTPAL